MDIVSKRYPRTTAITIGKEVEKVVSIIQEEEKRVHKARRKAP